ncbi:MAG: potassium-transporting ATPase subunit KdpB [Firmicutes bacterium]|nr:potassium-transporting ATPase subunit KdpB [Bacillota bacterium]
MKQITDAETPHIPLAKAKAPSLWNGDLVKSSLKQAVWKLSFRKLMTNPVMFVVEIGAIVTTGEMLRYLISSGATPTFSFTLQISLWLWLTVLFANFAEAMAEGRGKAHADELRKMRTDSVARKITPDAIVEVSASDLNVGDEVIVSAGEVIPADGEVVYGIATVDESAITGESAPVIRESGGDRSAVTGGTVVLSDEIRVRVTAEKGESFLDKMIALIEAGVRQKTPNEIALALLLSGLSMIFLIVVVTVSPFAIYSHAHVSVTVLVALLVALIPTTIGGLLSAIGISGMNRLYEKNVVALSGRAVEAAGDVSIILLDKTGTLTMGARQAANLFPARGIDVMDLAQAAYMSSLSDETPEGRSIISLCKDKYSLQNINYDDTTSETVEFSAQTKMSGIDIGGKQIRKGAVRQVADWAGEKINDELNQIVEDVSKSGSTPLLVAESNKILGVIELKDIVKPGIKSRLSMLRAAGIKTVMITGDNPITAAAIAEEAGVDDYLAEATPVSKMEYVKSVRAEGYMVAMVGDGTNDAPALANADVAVAMNTGTMAARQAGNMIDLDSNPTKLIDIVEAGKQILITRGALTTFSIVNDVAKYFAIIPAMFVVAYPGLEVLNVMHLASPESAILSAIIFNALIIPILIPLALKGIRYQAKSAASILRKNLLVYGLGGLVVPFIGIKLIDLAVTALHLVSLAR